MYGPDHLRVVHLEFDSMNQVGAATGWTPLHFKQKKVYVASGGMEVEYRNTVLTGGAVNWDPATVRVYVPAPGGNAGAAELNPKASTLTGHKFLLYYYDHLGRIQAIADFHADPNGTSIRRRTSSASVLTVAHLAKSRRGLG